MENKVAVSSNSVVRTFTGVGATMVDVDGTMLVTFSVVVLSRVVAVEMMG